MTTTPSFQPLGSSAELRSDRRSAPLGMGSTAAPVLASAKPSYTLASYTFSTLRHTTHYLECGPADGPLMILLHGWPEISLVWRAQMEAFAAEGWRCVALDLRGFGGSSAPAASSAYANEQVVADMVELHNHLGGQPAIWVGHDWGSCTAAATAAHEPKRSRGVVLVSVPYFPAANALPTLVPLVDRTIYPADQYPDGQWDYYRYYTTHFKEAVADLDADVASSLASIFRPGDPAAMGKPSPSATVTRIGGRFGAAHRAPPTKSDPALWPQADFEVLVKSFKAHGFRPACSWYLNDEVNVAYARQAPDCGRLSQPVLFVNGDWDQINSIHANHMGDPMRAACPDLTVANLRGAHWLPLERKVELTQTVRTWLQSKNL